MPNNRYEFDAIGTRWWIEVLNEQSLTEATIKSIHDIVKQFDQRYSRFREDSLVMKLFRDGSLSHPPAEMIRMLDYAKKMYARSGGSFDISVGNTLHELGYGNRRLSKSYRDKSMWNELTVTPAEILYPDGVILDFGGFGKGWLIDRLVVELKLFGHTEFIVNGGGDVYVESLKPVRFVLKDPYDGTRAIGHVEIAHGALAASDIKERVWDDNGVTRHHIIDPATQRPSESSVVASFVVAPSALIADTMATLLIVRPDLEESMKNEYGPQAVLVIRQNDT